MRSIVASSVAVFVSAAVVSSVGQGGRGQAPAARAIPRTADGKPDLSGIWQVLDNSLDGNIEPHGASYGVHGGQGAIVDPPDAPLTGTAWASIAVLGLLCTALAFLVYSVLVAEVGPGRAIVITYVAPVVALALGVAVLGERAGPGASVGLLLILAGSWISADGRVPPGLAAILTRRRLRTDP